MSPRLRTLLLTTHITVSLGWLGAVAAFLALSITGLTSPDAQLVRAMYLAMQVIAWFVIVPLAFAALLTGLVQSVGTPWGLLRHYWVLAKLLLTVVATIVLLQKMNIIGYLAGVAAVAPISATELREIRTELVLHAGGGLVVLFVIATISVFKPWGRTRYGTQQPREPRDNSRMTPMRPGELQPGSGGTPRLNPQRPSDTVRGRPGRTIALASIGVAVATVVILHLTGVMGHHH